jgi:hypothetical protein
LITPFETGAFPLPEFASVGPPLWAAIEVNEFLITYHYPIVTQCQLKFIKRWNFKGRKIKRTLIRHAAGGAKKKMDEGRQIDVGHTLSIEARRR